MGRCLASKLGRIDTSWLVRHVVANGKNQREMHLTVAPASGQVLAFRVTPSEAQTFSEVITKALALKAANGQTITQGGKKLVMRFETALTGTQAQGFSLNDNPDGTWFLGRKEPGFPDLARKYSSTSMQQFANYLDLGVVFVNALP
jgi:hypothetical protein